MIIKSKKKELYWNILSEKQMKELLNTAKKDYKKAIGELSINDYLKDYILDEKTRTKIVGFIAQKNKKSSPKLLDIGAGFGAVSVGLARKFDTTAVDTNSYTLKFIEYRAKQENVKIKLKKINQIYYGLPFKDNSFDIILMNGVLEWTACGVKGNVQKIHETVLKEVKRVLKKDGVFFLAIENRLAFDWMMGKTSHTPIKFIDLRSRRGADKICIKKTGKKYRTYIYSRLGYRNLLKKTGFKKLQFYTAYPTYQKPKYIRKNINPFANSFIISAEKKRSAF